MRFVPENFLSGTGASPVRFRLEANSNASARRPCHFKRETSGAGQLFLHGVNGVDVQQHDLRRSRIGDFQAEIFIERDDELERIYGIQAQATGTEQRQIIADLRRGHLELPG